MHGTSAADWRVEGSGDQVAPHVGLALMAAFADRVGLGDSMSGPLSRATPKTLRWRVFHAPARAIRTGRRLVVRLLDDWPDTPALLAAHQAINRLA